MRMLGQSAILSALFLLAAIPANAEVQYYSPQAPQPPAKAPPAARPKYPPSWYYDPYTNGSTVCPQGDQYGGPEQCKRLISPSYPAR